MIRRELRIVPDDWAGEQDIPDLSSYVSSLPDASGTFTGTYDQAVLDAVTGPPPDLIPVEVDTYDKPNLLNGAPPESVLTMDMGGRRFQMTVHSTESLGGNRVRAMIYRKSMAEVTGGD